MYNDINFNLDGLAFIKNVFNVVLLRDPSQLEYNIYLNDVLSDEKNLIYSKKNFLHKIIQSQEFLDNVLIKKIQNKKQVNKICFLICGHWREHEKYIEKYKNYLIKNKNIDIFIHTWSEQNPEIFSKVISSLSPNGMIIEQNNLILESFNWEEKNKNKTIFGNIGYKLKYGDFSKYIISQLYGIYKCNELKSNYEKINNIKYDLVIKMRADFFIDFNLDNFNNIMLNDDLLYIYNDNNHRHPMHGGGCAACMLNYPKTPCSYHENLICDAMLYGSSVAMDNYSKIYLETDNILNEFYIKNKHKMKVCKDYEHSHEMFYRTKNIESEEMSFMCCYPEQMLRSYLKNIFLISDPFKNRAEIK
jgi:hypothetical protein